jgi:hypothetical protein
MRCFENGQAPRPLQVQSLGRAAIAAWLRIALTQGVSRTSHQKG